MLRLAVALSAAVLLAPARPIRQVSTDWSTLTQVPAGTRVTVAYPNGQRYAGPLERVTDEGITIERKGTTRTLKRRDVASVSVLEPEGKTRRSAVIKWTAIGALGGLAFGILATAHYEHRSSDPTQIAVAMIGAAAGALAGSMSEPRVTCRERPIYVRP